MLTKDDINWLKSDFLPDLAKAVQDGLAGKLDAISTKLDKFVGDIQDKRTVQELHAKGHHRIDNRLTVIDKHLNISPKSD
jgi:hypothetical protein